MENPDPGWPGSKAHALSTADSVFSASGSRKAELAGARSGRGTCFQQEKIISD